MEKGEIIWTRKINGDANQPGEPAFSKVRKQKAEICNTPNKEGAQQKPKSSKNMAHCQMVQKVESDLP